MEQSLGKDGWIEHQRESWVWIKDRFVPYPFQYKPHRQPGSAMSARVQGLIDVAERLAHGRPS